MQHLHIVSHTHWDREWYRSFQDFRLKLVHLVDNLLAILENDPHYLHYMLDGQTIVLEDYLHMRMANLPLLQQYIRENRILIGPWYILPDEFLVSPEASIRNLIVGKQICELFGQRMMIGYIPDPFGHIGQMPQILNGFHIDTACLWRGVPADMPTLLWWQAPDGSRVLLSHLYTSYSNAAEWPSDDPDQSLMDLNAAADALMPHNPSSHSLLMRGTDHFEPRPQTPAHIAYYNQHETERQALHSTLPAYLAAVSNEIEAKRIQLPILTGELRDSHKANMLPAVLSTRMWIKQRNHSAQTLLERWVEPFCTWAELVCRGDEAFTPLTHFSTSSRISDPAPLIHQAWKLLLTNHPHDSICGCSIDQVHNEMLPRFDQVDQIGEELSRQSLQALSENVNTLSPTGLSGAYAALTIFNAAPCAQAGLIETRVDLPAEDASIVLYDQTGAEMHVEILDCERLLVESNTYTVSELAPLLSTTASGGYKQRRLVRAKLSRDGGLDCIEAEFSSVLTPDEDAMAQDFAEIMGMVMTADPQTRVKVKVYDCPSARLRFISGEVPAFGFSTYWFCRKDAATPALPPATSDAAESIENEFFSVTLNQTDATLTLLDKRSGRHYHGLNAFVDQGDRGDEYNFCPPEHNQSFSPTIASFETHKSALAQVMTIHYSLDLPASLSADRSMRSTELLPCPLSATLTLSKGSPALDFAVEFDNRAKDHRLEVHFPTGLKVNSARFDGHFDIVERNLALPETDESWVELPRPELPQRTFSDVSIADAGLMLANRGLPEVAVLRDVTGSAEICLTLLRCVGWLSRDDMWNRKGQAGPPLPTPGAQELGKHHFAYCLIPHQGDWLRTSQLAHSFQTPLRAILSPLQAGSLPAESAMLSVSPAAFLVTAIKPAISEEGWILRGVNLDDKSIQLQVKPAMRTKSAALVNLDESLIRELDMQPDNSLSLDLPAKRIVSILFRVVD